jgi:ATP-binding cassette, subfamily B, bacterial
MIKRTQFPHYRQLDQMDCGPTCLRMIAEHFGKKYGLQYLRERCYITREGVSMKGIAEGAKSIGLDTMTVKIPFESLEGKASLLDVPTPCIVHWNQNHFVVVYKVTKTHVWVADPAESTFKLTRDVFKKAWCSDGDKGIVLIVETTPAFYEDENTKYTEGGSKPNPQRRSLSFLLNYLRPYRRLLLQIVVGMLIGLSLQFVTPFLAQSVMDIGIVNRNLDFVYLILAAQTMLFLSQTSVSFIESWIFLHISSRVNIALVNDFLSKLLRLPIAYFETKMMGDIMQRIEDQSKIESFLTYSTLSVAFSTVNLLVFGTILLLFNAQIFFVFLVSSVFYAAWVFFFLRIQKELNYSNFQQMSENQQSLIELMEGIPEIKLQGSEDKRRSKWNMLQFKLFKLNVRTMIVGQQQSAGAIFITQAKDIIISFLSAKAVIEGDLSLGMMMSIQYIVGQVNAPFHQLVGFVHTVQDAQISLERLAEIHDTADEEASISQNAPSTLPPSGDIIIRDMSFKYDAIGKNVLKDINLYIPEGSVTAIVGTSGSGKTTLMKLLLGFYKPTEGTIQIGGTIPLTNISPKLWRRQCGAVMQNGFIFGDTIANNIAECDDTPDQARLAWATRMANLDEFVQNLPSGFNTKIGAKGSGISGGQQQRLLIARAIYRNPRYIFLDEATSALDSNNEKVINDNLQEFYRGRTVFIVAHRLSTVVQADQIVVLHNGEMVEIGNHSALVSKRGFYYNLVKNQLELSNE